MSKGNPPEVPTLVVTADDRSGAMETAALCADAGVHTWVCSWDGEPVADRDARCVVTDLRSRHVTAVEAGERMGAVLAQGVRPHAHKIDSTLRGNWATEVGVLAASGGVLLVASYPSAGRTCVGGEVRVYGVPLVESEFGADLRSAARTSRPVDALAALGIGDVVGASDADAVARWAEAGARSVCVADASSDDDVRSVVASVAGRRDIVVVGSALAVGAALAPRNTSSAPPSSPRPTLPEGPVLVVCGSRHAASRAQAHAAATISGVTVLFPQDDVGSDAEVVALELAVRAHDHLHAEGAELVVLLGGDTADAFLGERPVRVVASLAAGLALGEVLIDGRTVPILTKPGGFGQDQLLVELLGARGQR